MNKQLLLSILVVLFYTCLKVTAQCPTATVPDTVCAGEPLDITNTTPGFDSYYWDFCTGDLNNTPTGSNIGNPGNLLTAPHQIHIVEDSGNFYGFVANFSSNNILRLDYGSSPGNIPNIISLGPFTNLDGPAGIQIHKENNLWYALVSNYFSGNLVRVDIGNSIVNTSLIETSLGNSGFNNPLEMKIIKQNNSLYAFIANYTGNNLTIANFGNSITNNPVISNINGTFSNPFGIEIVYDCSVDKFIGFVTNLGFSNLNVLDFGNDLSLSPNITILSGLPIVNSTAIQILNENNEWHLLLTDESDNSFTHLNLGNNLLNSNPAIIYDGPLGALSTPRGIFFVNNNSQWNGMIINWGNSITQVSFPDTCSASPPTSEMNNPTSLLFITPGKKVITLKVTDIEGNNFYFTDSITVTEAPTSNFIFQQNICDNTIAFQDSSFLAGGSIISWLWDFGDGNSSNIEDPIHTYFMPGNYLVKLTVTASNGCSNTIQKTIFNEKPVASFSVADGCVVPPMEFINTSPDSQMVVTSFFWDFGDGNSSNLENPNHSYLNPGSYNVTFIASIGTCSDTATISVTYQPMPDVQFSVINTCLNQQQEFVNNSSIAFGTITSFDWNFGDGNSSNQVNPLHQFADTGTYNVELIAVGSNGCTDTLIKEVRITFQPNANFNFSPPVLCENNSIFFQDVSTIVGGIINSWFWSFGNGDTSFLQNPIYYYNSSGPFNITLTITAGTSCIDSITQNINIEPSPDVSFSAATVCTGDSTFFTDLSTTPVGNIISWDWNFGTGDSSNIQHPIYLFPNSGIFPVSLTVTSDVGCASTDTFTVHVLPIPAAEFTATNLCSNKLTQFLDSTIVSSGLVSSWSWNFGDPSSGINNFSSLQNPQHVFNSPGNYLVTLEVESDSGCQSTITKSILIHKTPYANFSSSQACDGEHVTFTYIDNSLPSNATNWLWNFGNGATSQIQDPASLYLTWGTYDVTLIVADSITGCSDTITKAIEVDPLPVAVIPDHTPCTGIPFMMSDSSYIPAGNIIDYEWLINSSIYTNPNPVVTFNDSGSYILSLVVSSDKGCKDSTSKTINVSGLPDAEFTFSPSFGNAPLNVFFTNLSSNAITYQWLFGDGQTSNSPGPSHIYSDTGSYNITLIAHNEFGCPDTITKTIYVIQPILDLAIIQLYPVDNNGYVTVSVEISNFGTREVNNFNIAVRLEGSSAIQEHWSGSLKSGETIIYSFNSSIERQTESGYICSIINEPNGEEDNNPDNNERCLSFNEELEILSIYPNPTTDNFILNFNLSKSEKIKIELLDSKGALVKEIYNDFGKKGFNSLSFSSKFLNIRNGIYFIKLFNEQSELISKFAKY